MPKWHKALYVGAPVAYSKTNKENQPTSMAQVYAVSVTHNFKDPVVHTIAEVRVFASKASAKAFMDEIANRKLPSYVSYEAELFTTPLEA